MLTECPVKWWKTYPIAPESENMPNKKTTLYEDFEEILMMAAGADGGVTALYIMQLVRDWDKEGIEAPFIRQFAKLCRMMKNGPPKREDTEAKGD